MTVILFIINLGKKQKLAGKMRGERWYKKTIQDKRQNYMQMQIFYANYMQSFWCPR